MLFKDKLPIVTVVFKKAKASDENGSLRVRVKHYIKKEPYLKSLGITIEGKYWDKRLMRVRDRMPKVNGMEAYDINTAISDEIRRLQDAFKSISDTGAVVTHNDITALMNLETTQPDNFLNFYKQVIARKKLADKNGETSLAKGYIRHLESVYRPLEAYCNYSLPYSAVTTDFLQRYEAHLLKNIANTTLHTKMKRLKSVIEMAIELGLIKKQAIAGYKLPRYMDPDRHYLTLEQIEGFASLVYNNEVEGVLRDTACYFVVECYSGLRFSDWSRFKIENIVDEPALRLRAKKNKEPVYLYLQNWPKLKKMCDYIQLHDIKPIKHERVANQALGLLVPMVNAKYQVRINFKVTTHIGRHSAATLLAMMGYTDSEGAEILAINTSTFGKYRKNTRQNSRLAQKRLGGI